MRYAYSIVILLLLFSCSSSNELPNEGVNDDEVVDTNNPPVEEEDPVEEEEEEEFDPVEKEYNLEILTTSGDDEIQLSLEYVSGNVVETNLTQELGIQKTDYYIREIENSLLSFHSWPSSYTSISTYQKDVISGSIDITEDYCILPPDANGVNNGISLYTGNQNKLVLVHSTYDIPVTLEQYYVTIYDKASGECKQVELDPNPKANQISLGIQFQIINEDVLALLYVTGDNLNPTVAFIDLESATVLSSKIFNRFSAGSFYNGDFLAIRLESSNFLIETYDIQSFELESTKTANGLPSILYGLSHTVFFNDQFSFEKVYPASEHYRRQPAIYDMGSDKVVEGNQPFLEELAVDLQDELGTAPIFPVRKVDVENRNIILGYDRNDGSETGGIVFTNFDLEVYKVVELDYVPEEIIIKSVN
ncbi:hypothetical protein [Flagellimonas myxillae]|uniref:hypothetical protein n=1 Tax=Flagellimonas myxillae TaxID=2942214 RepID=UPI00201F42FB|nr:hypothetical protein [Muricauda myxillae]MCL6265731.1 hypothetical protein [Muricauda myxillae]